MVCSVPADKSKLAKQAIRAIHSVHRHGPQRVAPCLSHYISSVHYQILSVFSPTWDRTAISNAWCAFGLPKVPATGDALAKMLNQTAVGKGLNVQLGNECDGLLILQPLCCMQVTSR